MSVKRINRDYWKAEEELIIQQWADKAKCYQWMHSKCHDIYYSKNAWYTIPVIIISTITGTANFAQDRFSDDMKSYVVMGIGTLSILAGIITTIHQFLKIAELNEGHRVASISWCKFHNNLQTLVLRHPLDRMSPDDAINLYKEEYDRLLEISPNISKNILKLFNTTFKKNEDLSKPEICSKLKSTRTYQMTPEERQKMIDGLNKKKPKNKKMVDTFFQINGREPMEEELNTNISGNILDDNLFGTGSITDSGDIEADETNNEELDQELLPLPELVDSDEEEIEEDISVGSVTESNMNLEIEIDGNGNGDGDGNGNGDVNVIDNDNFINTASV
jgi:hypothetical protein